ncbi:uroporphyrinogen decarboxylase family protein [Geomonas edaphica]|uniref:uroporphyrinogen decarboxylase family protein n=1 Tax=Geomonas edaphica TaxID=2570226 RepID=UPI0010A77A41|nr:uroporphyrinogen decarboxylase family protein [Geomonas edaphica]
MNSYRRVMNTLGGLPVDRPPVFAVLGAYGAALTGCDLRTLYSDPAAYLAGQKAVQESYGFDLVLAPFDFSAISEAFGGETVWGRLQTPNVRRPPAGSVAEALAMPLPSLSSTGRLPVALEATRGLARCYKEEVPVIAVLPGPGVFPALLIGLESWLETVLFEPDQAARLLAHSAHFLIAFADALLEAGADCLVFTEGMASAEIAPRELFAEAILPHLTDVLRAINGPKVISSTGGRMNHVLDLLPGLPGVVGAIVGSRDDIAESRRLTPPGFNLIGNLDNLAFASAGSAKIGRLALDCLSVAAPAGHFVLSNSGGDLPQETPAANLKAFKESVSLHRAGHGEVA